MKSIAIGIGSIVAWEIGKVIVRGVLAAISMVLFLVWLWQALTRHRGPLWH